MWALILVSGLMLVGAGYFALACDDDDDDDSGGTDWCAKSCDVFYNDCDLPLWDGDQELPESECVAICHDYAGEAECRRECLEAYDGPEDCDALSDCTNACWEGDDDTADDDDTGGGNECDTLVYNLYEVCQIYLYDGEGNMISADDAYAICIEGWDATWQCMWDCLSASTTCGDFGTCLDDYCF
jgi:hypothetical protein